MAVLGCVHGYGPSDNERNRTAHHKTLRHKAAQTKEDSFQQHSDETGAAYNYSTRSLRFRGTRYTKCNALVVYVWVRHAPLAICYLVCGGAGGVLHEFTSGLNLLA